MSTIRIGWFRRGCSAEFAQRELRPDIFGVEQARAVATAAATNGVHELEGPGCRRGIRPVPVYIGVACYGRHVGGVPQSSRHRLDRDRVPVPEQTAEDRRVRRAGHYRRPVPTHCRRRERSKELTNGRVASMSEPPSRGLAGGSCGIVPSIYSASSGSDAPRNIIRVGPIHAHGIGVSGGPVGRPRSFRAMPPPRGPTFRPAVPLDGSALESACPAAVLSRPAFLRLVPPHLACSQHRVHHAHQVMRRGHQSNLLSGRIFSADAFEEAAHVG